jgi:hypothetical protein
VHAGLGFDVMFHNDDYFSSGVTFSQIPEGVRGIAQWVHPVDDQCDLAGFNELLQSQLLPAKAGSLGRD